MQTSKHNYAICKGILTKQLIIEESTLIDKEFLRKCMIKLWVLEKIRKVPPNLLLDVSNIELVNNKIIGGNVLPPVSYKLQIPVYERFIMLDCDKYSDIINIMLTDPSFAECPKVRNETKKRMIRKLIETKISQLGPNELLDARVMVGIGRNIKIVDKSPNLTG